MENVTTPGQVLFLLFLFCAFCVGAWWWLHPSKKSRTPVDFNPADIVKDTWAALVYWRPSPVSHSEDSDPHVMSRSEEDDLLSRPLSPQTDDAQTDRRVEMKAPGRAELLTLYTAMRAAGMSREKARPALKAVGLPLDNNLWVEAAPAAGNPDEPQYVTPIVGRPTAARFETDPEYPYQAPAR